MTWLMRPAGWTQNSAPSREILILNEFRRGDGGDHLRAVDIDTGHIRIVVPFETLARGLPSDVRPHNFGGMLVDANPDKNTVYIIDCTDYTITDHNSRIFAVTGL